MDGGEVEEPWRVLGIQGHRSMRDNWVWEQKFIESAAILFLKWLGIGAGFQTACWRNGIGRYRLVCSGRKGTGSLKSQYAINARCGLEFSCDMGRKGEVEDLQVIYWVSN